MRPAARQRPLTDLGGPLRLSAPPRRGRLLLLFSTLLAPLLGGYLLLDRAFAYLHLPGTPLHVGEIVLGTGLIGLCTATGYLRIPLRDEPTLALLAAFVAWGALRSVPGLTTHGIDAVRDAALWYYAIFAFLVVAAVAQSPRLPESLVDRLARFSPWLLLWLPAAMLLSPFEGAAPTVPFTTVSVLSHKPGNAAIAALMVLASMWLLPGRRGLRSRAAWSILALVTIALVATQNRGGMLAVLVGGLVGLAYLQRGAQVFTKAFAVGAVGLVLALLLPLRMPLEGWQGRGFSADQLLANVSSLVPSQAPANLKGTVDGRRVLWTRIIDKQVTDGRLVEGSGFGQNLAAEVGVLDEGQATLRNPHNSHLHVLARMGLVGLVLWIALWAAWFRRLVVGIRRRGRQATDTRRQIAVLCLVVASATLTASTFDPQVEGPQIAILLWTVFGIGVAVTSTRTWAKQ